MEKPRQKVKRVLGVTGGFGCGKTTVAAMLSRAGAVVIDADAVAHALMRPRTAVYRRIRRFFGAGVVSTDGQIDRQALSRIVFTDPVKLVRLNRIMHPAIIASMRRQIRRVTKGMVVLDAPLLFETGLDRMADAVIVVKASPARQRQRIKARDGLSGRQIALRIKAQIPLSEKIRRADFVIDNTGTKINTLKQVQHIRRQLWRS
ncbi:MAG TPA: dephospho-CoA kinase [Candidatus Omnitrophota bacterium]|nr:dephospho-CoA kinase [Candidatus Omnitrophota bacterium]HRZ14967.1 dephospho-CoA kinase [Candidatus Omnitrophota bacterium]